MKLRKNSGINLLLAAGAACLLAGCAVDHQSTGFRGIGLTYKSDVKTLADGNFFVEAEAALGAGRQSGASKIVMDEASAFCARRSQKMVEISSGTSSPDHEGHNQRSMAHPMSLNREILQAV